MTASGVLAPIAVVGASCRFPGGAHDLESLWELLYQGRNAWSETPAGRFNGRASHHPSRGSSAAHTHKGGHFLDQDIRAFDAGFFGISLDEANAMDPQQRLQLEIAYEALESAGIAVENIKCSNTGVYIATFTHDYENMMYRDVLSLPKYFMTGVGQAIVSNRISYTFDLKGPSMTLDTGCSGSLVALHLACQSLRSGETNMALVGGTNLILTSDSMIPMDALHLLNSDGRCYSFDSRGAGYGRGEGVAMIVLKRLEDALDSGDPIRTIVRNTAIGQDGKTSGITLPNGAAQQQLIRSTYASVLLDPCDVGYVEAHGSGTVAGDLTEMDAIETVFCENRKHPLYVGSIKANVGHLESTSGLAGVIKAILVLEKDLVPSTPSLEVLKEKLKSLSSDIKIPRALERWPTGVVKRASINSFGYGGANAHAIIEAPAVSSILPNHRTVSTGNGTSHSCDATSRLQIFTVTARSERSLQKILRNLHAWVKSRVSTINLVDLAYTLISRRSLMHWRYTFVACTHQMILDSLEVSSVELVRVAKTNRLTYIFEGQGAQWYAMGRELFCIPYFKASLAECASILRDLGATWNLLDELARDEAASKLGESKFGQPAITILQIGVVDLLSSLGVTPNTVLGHSSGEIAAAYAAGALSKATAIKVAYYRSFLAERSKTLMSTGGAMLAVALGEEEVDTYINQISAGRMAVACCNSPLSTTVSGDRGAIVKLQDSLNRFAISSKLLKIDTAYHSHHMEVVAEEYLQHLSGLETESIHANVKFYSSVTGDEKTSGFGPSYWVENLISKVRFQEGLEALYHKLHQDSTQVSVCHNFVDIGPSSTLTPSVEQTLKHLKVDGFRYNCISTLRKHRNSHKTFLQALGKLFEQGFQINLDAVNSLESPNSKRTVITNLPPYPFDHSVLYWHESRLHKEHRMRSQPYHDLLGLRIPGDTSLEPTWRHLISPQALPWLRDHTIDDRMVFPASGYIAMAIEAKAQLHHVYYANSESRIRQYVLSDLIFSQTLEVPESESVEVHLTMRYPMDDVAREPSARHEFHVSSVSFDGVVKEHCRGYIAFRLSACSDDAKMTQERYEQRIAEAQLQRLCRAQRAQYPRFDPTSIYEIIRSNGHHWGPNFARIKSLSAGENEATGTVSIPDVARSMPGNFMHPHVIHPATLDAFIHSGLILFTKTYGMSLMFPVAMAELIISADALATPNKDIDFVVSLVSNEFSSASTTIAAFPKNSKCGAELLLYIGDSQLEGTMSPRVDIDDRCAEACYQLEWGVDIDVCNPPPNASSPDDERLRNTKVATLSQAAYQFVGLCLDQANVADAKESYLEYFAWMKQFHEIGPPSGIEVASEDLYHCLPSWGVEGEALHRIGSNLRSIITGQSDPLSLLLQDDLLSRIYAEDASHLRCYAHLIDYVKHIVFKEPGTRVLEIGAGTGGASLPLMRALHREESASIGHYDFTDISSGFFEDARKKLARWKDRLSFKTLDIGRDPTQQGFSEGDYDMVLASNSLHATRSVDDAIANVRKLLRPGGRLVLLEITKLTSFTNAIFGVLPDWYRGKFELLESHGARANWHLERNDGRIGAPTLSVQQWDSRLREGSFSGVDHSVPDYTGSAQQMTVMFSKAISPALCPSSVSILLNPEYENTCFDCSQSLGDLIVHRSARVSFQNLPLKEVNNEEIYIVIDGASDLPLTDKTSWWSTRMTGFLQSAKKVLWVVISVHPGDSSRASKVNSCVPSVFQHEKDNNLKLVKFEVSYVENLSNLCSKIFEVMRMSFCGPADLQSQETVYIYTGNSVLIPRLVPSSKLRQKIRQRNTKTIQTGSYRQRDRPLRLDPETSSSAKEDLHFIEYEFDKPLAPSDIEVEVHAWGLDSQVVLAKSSSTVGEFSGRVVNVGSDIQNIYRIGDRVCSWGGNSYSSLSRVDATQACHLPDYVPFSIAVSIPVIYSTVYHGLVELASLTKGQTVLIHTTTDSTGEAAVRIAQHIGAKIIMTTDGGRGQDPADKLGISKEFVLSRTSDIVCHVRVLTEGRGVDAILSTTENQSFEGDCACLKPFGRYVEIRRPGGNVRRKGAMACPGEDVIFCSVSFEALMKHRPLQVREHIRKILSWPDDGLLTPLHHVKIQDVSEIANVYKSIHRGLSTGNYVLEITKGSVVKWSTRKEVAGKLSQDASFILAGDFGQWGLDICRYVASRKVQYVALLTWSTRESEQLNVFENQLQRFGINVRVISLRLFDKHLIRSSVSHALEDWPTVKGVIEADMLYESSTSKYAKFGDSTMVSQSLLSMIYEDYNLDFFVKLSPCTNVFSRQCEDPWSAVFKHPRALDMGKGLEPVCLLVGVSKNFNIVSQDMQPMDNMYQQAILPISSTFFYSLLDYVTGSEAKSHGSSVLITGFDKESLDSAGYNKALKHPMLNHIRQPEESAKEETTKPSASAVEESLTDAKNGDEARRIVTKALHHKMSSVAFDYDITDLQTAVTDFAMDSLVVLRIRNWIFQAFRADLEPREISDAVNIIALAGLVLERTTFTQYKQEIRDSHNCDTEQVEPEPGPTTSLKPLALPHQPLPLLSESLQAFLNSARPFCSDEEFRVAFQATEEFKAPGSMGNVLHDRLVERAEDPQIDNWLADSYLNRRYLSVRKPLVAHQSYFGTHALGRFSMNPAERAAIVTLAVFHFKKTLESGNLETQYLSGQAVDPDSYQWLFNACREPCVGIDRIHKYPNEDYIVVMRRGHIYKILLEEGTPSISLKALKAVFGRILESSITTISWLSILTADERDEWAKFRSELIDINEENRVSMQTIEAAAFVVCLDDAKPVDSEDRFRQFLIGDGSNRWYDKTLQIVICNNGVSASVYEHAAVDGFSVKPLQDLINSAILEYERPLHSKMIDPELRSNCAPTRISLTTTMAIDNRISQFSQRFQNPFLHCSFASVEIASFGNDFFSTHRCPVQSGIQLAIQLASWRFFGSSPPAHETVSMAFFRKGRVEVHPIIQPAVAEFLTAASEQITASSKLRALAFEAAKSHTKSLSRASKGHGFSRHMLALEWMMREGESTPMLFENPVYARMKPGKVITSSFKSGWVEGGFVYPVLGGIFIYFEVKNDRVSFSIFGHDVNVKDFRNLLQTATKEMKALLSDGES